MENSRLLSVGDEGSSLHWCSMLFTEATEGCKNQQDDLPMFRSENMDYS